MHSHIVPSVDDGARTHAEAAAMVNEMRDRLAVNSTVVFTPHYSTSMNKRVVEAKRSRSVQFREFAEGEYSTVLNFLTAGELMIQGSSLNHLEAVRYPGTGWVLVEFYTGVSWIETLIQLKRIVRKGYSPLIAHPERYKWCRRKNERLITLSKMGCGALISARSFKLPKYATTARLLLGKGYVHAISSDAHSPSDYILDNTTKKMIEDSSRIPWQTLTSDIPDIILDDGELPELPLR